jgi:hypothetical protein
VARRIGLWVAVGTVVGGGAIVLAAWFVLPLVAPRLVIERSPWFTPAYRACAHVVESRGNWPQPAVEIRDAFERRNRGGWPSREVPAMMRTLARRLDQHDREPRAAFPATSRMVKTLVAALTAQEDPRARPVLERVAASGVWSWRIDAIVALHRIDPPLAEAMIVADETSPDTEPRHAAVEACAAIFAGPPPIPSAGPYDRDAITRHLARALIDDPDDGVAEAAKDRLGILDAYHPAGCPAVVGVLTAALAAPGPVGDRLARRLLLIEHPRCSIYAAAFAAFPGSVGERRLALALDLLSCGEIAPLDEVVTAMGGMTGAQRDEFIATMDRFAWHPDAVAIPVRAFELGWHREGDTASVRIGAALQVAEATPDETFAALLAVARRDEQARATIVSRLRATTMHDVRRRQCDALPHVHATTPPSGADP